MHWLTGGDLTEACGITSSPSTWKPARANGAGPISPASFFSLVGEAMRDRILLVMASVPAAGSPAPSTSSVRTPYSAGIGARSSIIRSCTSSCATTGDRLRDRRKLSAPRGRRAGRTQDRPRLHASDDLFGPLHRRPGAATRHCRLPQARTRLRCRRRQELAAPAPTATSRDRDGIIAPGRFPDMLVTSIASRRK